MPLNVKQAIYNNVERYAIMSQIRICCVQLIYDKYYWCALYTNYYNIRVIMYKMLQISKCIMILISKPIVV